MALLSNMKSFWSRCHYALTGPYWPEYLVAKELRAKGWEVFRHFYVYDPKNKAYAEMDILAIAHDGLIMVEVKSYEGAWESFDFEEKVKWRKVGQTYKRKSPVWQLKRTRLALINSLLKDFPDIKSNIINATHSYVYLDRGHIINAQQPEVLKAWKDMKVTVHLLSERNLLPYATKPAAESFRVWAHEHHAHFRWRWHYKILKKWGYLESHLNKLHEQWHHKINKVKSIT